MSDFKARVHEIVAQIPKGKMMTYGQIATMAGSPRAARQVGQVAHWGNPDLPWHRVVNAQGGLARGYTDGGLEGHRRALEADGYEVADYRVAIDELIWWP